MTLQACSACLMVCYCSRTCQKADWKQHKQLCKLLTGLRQGGPHLFHRDPAAQVLAGLWHSGVDCSRPG